MIFSNAIEQHFLGFLFLPIIPLTLIITPEYYLFKI